MSSRYADRLSPEDRASMLATSFACSARELAPREPKPRKERTRPAAPEHRYRACTIYDIPNNEIIVRCAKRDCRDDTHRVRAALEPRP